MIKPISNHMTVKPVIFFIALLFFSITDFSVSFCFAEEYPLPYKLWEKEESLQNSFNFYLPPLERLETFLPPEDDKDDSNLIEAIIESEENRDPDQKTELQLELGLKEAVQFAVATNRDVQLAMLKPMLAGIELKVTETVYDPTLFSEGTYYDNERPIQSVLDTGREESYGDDSLFEEGWTSRTGLSQPLSTGGEVALIYEADNLENNSDLTIPNPQYTSRIKLELRQSLLKEFGDQSNKTDIELAAMGNEQAEANFRRSLNNLAKELALHYWRYKYYFQLEQISRAAVEAGREIFKKIKVRKEQGMANELDESRVESTLMDRMVTHIGYRKSMSTTLDQLKKLLGISPLHQAFDAEVSPTEPFAEGLTDTFPERKNVVAAALETREEIFIARQRIKMAEVKMQLAKHLRLPTLDAKTSYTLNGLGEDYGDSLDGSVSGDHESWDVGFVFEWAIGGEKNSLEFQKSVLLRRQAQLQYKQLVEKVVYEVNTIHNELLLSAEEVLTADLATTAYEKVLDHENTLFEISRGSNQKLLDAQDSFYDAKRIHLRALMNLNLGRLKLQWAEGSLLNTFDILE